MRNKRERSIRGRLERGQERERLRVCGRGCVERRCSEMCEGRGGRCTCVLVRVGVKGVCVDSAPSSVLVKEMRQKERELFERASMKRVSPIHHPSPEKGTLSWVQR